MARPLGVRSLTKMKWIKIASITCLAVITLSVMFFAFSPVLVGAISGVDNATAYSEALQALVASLQETLSKIVDNSGKMVDAMDKTQAQIIKLFEKAVAP